MTASIDFYFDYVSPYTYLANTQLAGLGVPVRFVPVVIVDVMRTVNNQPSPLCPPKGKYIGIDAARWAAVYDVRLSTNAAFWEAVRDGSLSTKTLINGAVAALELGVWDRYHDAMFSAVWSEHRDLAGPQGLADFARDQGLPAGFWDHAGSAEVKERAAANGSAAAERGVFGSPTFFLNDEMFFGNDRLDMIRQRLGQPERGLTPRSAS